MSETLIQPLDIAQAVLDLLKDVDHFTAAEGVAIAHRVLGHMQTKLIYELQNS